MQEEYNARLPESKENLHQEFIDSLNKLGCQDFMPEAMEKFIRFNPEYKKILKKMRGAGLVKV